MMRAITRISSGPMPRVASPGLPRRRPLPTAGGLSSYGIVFLLA